MKFLKGVGWLFVPYIMLPFQWKKIGKIGKAVGTFWAVIALIIAISNSGSNKNTSQTTAATPDSTTKQAQPGKSVASTAQTKTAATPAPSQQLSKEGVSSNVKIVVESFETKTEIGNPDVTQAKAQGVFKVLKLNVTNNQKDAITLDQNSFKLVDSQGREFTASTEAQTAFEMSGSDKNSFFLKQLNPGLTAEGEIAFDVPKDAKGFVLKARGGYTGDEITLKVE